MTLETQAKVHISKKENKVTRKDNKNLTHRERVERPDSASKLSIDEQKVCNQTHGVGSEMKKHANFDCNDKINRRKYLQLSVSFPNLKEVRKRPIWKPRSLPNKFKSSKISFLKSPTLNPFAVSDMQPSPHRTSVSFNNQEDVRKSLPPLWNSRSMQNITRVSKTALFSTPNLTYVTLLDNHLSLHRSDDLNENQENGENSISPTLSSWEELQLSSPNLTDGFCDCTVSPRSTSSLSNWEVISTNDILDNISPSLSSTFTVSSSFSLLEIDLIQRSKTSSSSPEVMSISSLVSSPIEINTSQSNLRSKTSSTPEVMPISSLMSPTIEVHTPQSNLSVNQDYLETDELPTPMTPKRKKFYHELWPPNPWLSAKYNGFPNDKGLKHQDRDDYWTTDRDGDPLRITKDFQFTWCDDTGTVTVVRKPLDKEASQNNPASSSEDNLPQTQLEAKIQKNLIESINLPVEDKNLRDDGSNEKEENENFCIISSSLVCSSETASNASNKDKVKSGEDGHQQQHSGEDVFNEQPLHELAAILSSTPTFPTCDIKPTGISYFNHPGHVFTENLSQLYTGSECFDRNSYAAICTLLSVTFYLFGMQSGDILDSHDLNSTVVKKWLWKTTYVGNALTRSTLKLKKSKNTSATEAFKVVRECFQLNSLAWRSKEGDAGKVSTRLSKQPTNLFLDIVKPYNLLSSLAFRTTQLDPNEGEAILYTINENYFLLLPTCDNRVILIDIKPHDSLGGGAIILFSARNTKSIQNMLNEFYLKTIKPFYNYSLGLAYIICCPIKESNRLIPRYIEEWISGI